MTTCSSAFIRRVVRAISSASRRTESSSAATSSSRSSTDSKRSATPSMRARVATRLYPRSVRARATDALLDLDDRNARNVAGAHAHLDISLRGERRGMHRLGPVGRDREPEKPARVCRVAVERVERVQSRRPEPMELAHQGGPPFLEQVAALGGEPDPRPPREQLTPGRAHLFIQHHRQG